VVGSATPEFAWRDREKNKTPQCKVVGALVNIGSSTCQIQAMH